MTLRAAAALSMAAAVSLGLARFSYALLLPPMRQDLGWSYLTAGAMNAVNAAGYLLGALLMPRVLARFDARPVMLGGAAGAALLLALHALVRADALLFALRGASGVASAAAFVAGGVLAARLATAPGARPGLVLGLYYGGTGVGIVVAALLVPLLAGVGWPAAWAALGLASLAAAVVAAMGSRDLGVPPRTAGASVQRADLRPLRYGLAGYGLFGVGYIGYMTFIVTLLRDQGLPGGAITAFYVLLGLGVIASSWIWAGLLQRHRGGVPMALLNALLALATLLPVVTAQPLVVFVSGALFGGVMLSVVASSTALVRASLAPLAWPAGIAAFTTVFAAGQVVGPVLVGLVADGPGGLQRGLAFSAALLALGAWCASRQRPVPAASGA